MRAASIRGNLFNKYGAMVFAAYPDETGFSPA
jgi:hypothetical protein